MNATRVRWRRSSRSGAQSNCVELAWAGAIRDSKSPGPTLAADLGMLISVVKTGRLDR
jgi:hypothetical protein